MWHVLLLTQRLQCLSFCSSVSYLKEESAANTKIHSGILHWIHKPNLSQLHSQLTKQHFIGLLGFTKVSVSRGQVTLAISKGGKDFTYFCSFKFVCDDDEMHMLLSCEP
jgi:hypothetical protein